MSEQTEDMATVVIPPRQFKVVATDLDGTFLGERIAGSAKPNLPTKENKAAFTKLASKGVHLAMISGRCYTTTSVMMDHCELDQYVISCHGAIIFGPKGVGPARPLVKSWALASDLLRTAVQLAQDTDTLLMLYTATGIHSCGRADHNLTFVNGDGEPMGEWWSRVGEFPIPIEGHPVFEALPPHLKEVVRASPLTPNSRHFATFEEVQAFIDGSPDEPIFKAILVAEPPRISATLAAAHGAIPRHVGNVMGPFEGWMEIIHPEANKAVAVEWLCQKVGTTLEHAITLGDGLNDLEMLQQAGLGIAMANAVTEAKQAANVVSRFTNHESAVAKELQRLVDAGFLPP